MYKLFIVCPAAHIHSSFAFTHWTAAAELAGLFFFKIILCVWAFCLQVYLCSMCMSGAYTLGVGSTGTEVINGCEPPC